MKHYALVLLPALLMTATVHASDRAPQRHPLRPIAHCLDVTKINEWHIIDARTLTARTGPHRFLIKTQYSCPRLGRYGPEIRFRPSNDKQAVGMPRICGDLGDQVSSRAQPACEVQSVKEIDKKQFDALNLKSVRTGTAAELPMRVPPPTH